MNSNLNNYEENDFSFSMTFRISDHVSDIGYYYISNEDFLELEQIKKEKKLIEKYPILKEAWENYQILVKMYSK